MVDNTNNKDHETFDDIEKAKKMMELEEEKIRLENEDKKEDAQRKMSWFALSGMLLYPFAVVLAELVGLENASKILGDMAATYFVSVAAIVMAFYAKEGYVKGKE